MINSNNREQTLHQEKWGRCRRWRSVQIGSLFPCCCCLTILFLTPSDVPVKFNGVSQKVKADHKNKEYDSKRTGIGYL